MVQPGHQQDGDDFDLLMQKADTAMYASKEQARGTYSFFPAKNLGAFGDGGAVTTSDDKVLEVLKQLRNHGSKVRYHHEMEGFNSRLDTVQAAILSVRLKHVEKWTEMRNKVAAKYAGDKGAADKLAEKIIKGGAGSSRGQWTSALRNTHSTIMVLGISGSKYFRRMLRMTLRSSSTSASACSFSKRSTRSTANSARRPH